MLPKTYLTQLVPPRIAEALRRVEAAIWRPLPAAGCNVSQTVSFRAHRQIDSVSADDFTPVPAEPFYWGPKFAQRWFKVELPAVTGDEVRYFVWEDSGEATAYLRGEPYYGLDHAHRYCPLPKDVRQLCVEAVCIRGAIWLDGRAPALAEEGCLYRPPHLMTRNDLAWSVYHDLAVLLDLLKAELYEYQPSAKEVTNPMRYTAPFNRASPLARRLCHELEWAIDAFDRGGLSEFALELKKIYANHPSEPGAVRAILTGHAHIDLVWLWPESVGEFKAVHTWSTQTRLLELYPEFKFGYSQPASYSAVAARAPALHRRVRELISVQRWEATGASYVESDTQLPCGEALLRSLRVGQAEFRKLRGSPATVFWLPDVFGYSNCVPQLLRGLGVEGFFTTKLGWSTITQFPHTSFRWRGADGSEVVSHINLRYDYNEAVEVQRLRENALHHQQSGVHPEFLVPTGYGDGGGGPTEAMCERARRVASLTGVPRTEWGSIEDFFERLRQVSADLPVFAGELLLEFHRGVLTTHGRLKAAFRALERALQTLEAAHVATGRGPVDEHYWRRLIFAQFHDYIPGSSIWEVYVEGIPELERLAARAVSEAQRVLGEEGERAWFNPLPIARNWIIEDCCVNIPALSGGPAASFPVVHLASPVVSSQGLSSDRVEVSFDLTGGINRLVIDGHAVAMAHAGHELWIYHDRPALFEAWDVDRTSLVSGSSAVMVGPPSSESTATEAAMTFRYRIGQSNEVAVRYSLVVGEPVLRIEYNVDWRDPESLLMALFTSHYSGGQARFGAPFGSTLRSQKPEFPREEAQWKVPGSRWAVVTDDAQSDGMVVLTEAKYGFTARDGAIGVSLLRSAVVTDADQHPLIRETPDRPRYSDLGHHVIKLALGHYRADLPLESQPATLAELLFTPCIPFQGEATTSGIEGIFHAPSLAPVWGEPIGPGNWRLRLHETMGRRGTALLRLSPEWEATLTGLDGNVLKEIWSQTEYEIPFSPYRVVTVALRKVPISTATSDGPQ